MMEDMINTKDILDTIDKSDLNLGEVEEFNLVTSYVSVPNKETQAAWKLAGLCQLCGATAVGSNYEAAVLGHPHTSACNYSEISTYVGIPTQCLDRQGYEKKKYY